MCFAIPCGKNAEKIREEMLKRALAKAPKPKRTPKSNAARTVIGKGKPRK